MRLALQLDSEARLLDSKVNLHIFGSEITDVPAYQMQHQQRAMLGDLSNSTGKACAPPCLLFGGKFVKVKAMHMNKKVYSTYTGSHDCS